MNKRLTRLLMKEQICDGDFLDDYNQKVIKEVSETITVGISFRNHQFVAVDDAVVVAKLNRTSYESDNKVFSGDGVSPTIRAEHHGHPPLIVDEVVKVGNYMPSGYSNSAILDPSGIAPYDNGEPRDGERSGGG